jgi:hypothetical protein
MPNSYVQVLTSSTLPLPTFVVIALAVLLLVASHASQRAALAATAAQDLVRRGTPGADPRPELRLEALRLMSASALIGASLALGPRAFAFFAGGYVLVLCYTLSANLRTVRYMRALAVAGAGEGSIAFPTATVWRARSSEALGAGLFCLLAGLLLAQLALLGAALLLLAMTSGHARRARREERLI